MKKVLYVIGVMLTTVLFAVAEVHAQEMIVGWGYQTYPYIPEGTEFKSISAGGYHSLLVTKEGRGMRTDTMNMVSAGYL
ncbi:MAG: hypothetical protein ACP5JO_01055 [Candidatus Ratteibacteria bacterium]